MRLAPGVSETLRSIAANVRRLRERRGLTQEKVAELADLDLRFLQRIEAAKTNLGVAVLVSLARALDATPAALVRRAELTPRPRGRPRTRGTKRPK